MPLVAVVESLEEVAEDVRDEYAPTDDGKFKLKLLDGLVPEKDADTFEELRGALTKERGDLRAAKEEHRTLLTSIESLGGLDGLKELVEAAKEGERTNLEKKGEYDALLQQVRDENATVVAKKDEVIAGLRTRLDKEIRGRQVMEAISTAEGNPHLLQSQVMGAARLEGEDGSDELSVRVYDPETNVMLVDKDGQPLSVQGYVERLKTDERFAPAFKGSGHSGGGAPTDGDGETSKPDGEGEGAGAGAPVDLATVRRSSLDAASRVKVIRYLQEQNGGDYSKAEEAFFALPL